MGGPASYLTNVLDELDSAAKAGMLHIDRYITVVGLNLFSISQRIWNYSEDDWLHSRKATVLALLMNRDTIISVLYIAFCIYLLVYIANQNAKIWRNFVRRIAFSEKD